jgi:hypothetical protein
VARTLDVKSQSKVNYDAIIARRKKFQRRNSEIRHDNEDARVLSIKRQQDFCGAYVWLTMIYLFDSMERLQRYHREKVYLREQFSIYIKYIIKIQRKIREVQASWPTKDQGSLARTKLGIHLRTQWMRGFVYERAKAVAGEFIKTLLVPRKAYFFLLQYVLIIRNLKIRLKKHMKTKKRLIAQLDDKWNVELMNLVNGQTKLSMMKVNFDADNVKFVSSEMRIGIITHVVNRQLLRYTDVRYESLKEKTDQMIEKKARQLTQGLENIEKREVEYRTPRNRRDSNLSKERSSHLPQVEVEDGYSMSGKNTHKASGFISRKSTRGVPAISLNFTETIESKKPKPDPRRDSLALVLSEELDAIASQRRISATNRRKSMLITDDPARRSNILQ